jgi:crotonobetaine/carnitine-CoA ligase
VLLDEDEVPRDGSRYEDLLTAAPSPPVQARPGDLISIVYTSGTTAEPKGCMLSHGYYTAIGPCCREGGWMVPGNRGYAAFPLFHSSGQLVGIMSTLVNDCSLAVAIEFHASTYMAEAAALDATMLVGAGVIANAVLNQPRQPQDGEHPFRLVLFAPLAPARQLEFEERFRTPVMSEGFGQTESILITQTPINGLRDRATSGRPSPLYEVVIVDADDNPVPGGTAGEIVVRPQHANTMYSGYWNKPEATVAAWSNLWHHTGDFGRMDENGFLTFVDRMKDRLRRRGENVSSVHLEETLRGMPGVADVAVCAVPGQLGDDDIKACVVESEPGAVTAENDLPPAPRTPGVWGHPGGSAPSR